jgi:hypothetical protein
MIAARPLPVSRTSQTARALSLVVALVLGFVCLPGIVHGTGDPSDGCPQIKLEGQRLSTSLSGAASPPARLFLGEPPALAWGLHADRLVTPSSVVSRRASPRAPPTA